MIKREIESCLLAIACKYPVVTITGPRQSGKTTLAKTITPPLLKNLKKVPDTLPNISRESYIVYDGPLQQTRENISITPWPQFFRSIQTSS